MLRYQINPHFLFNTLNAIRALVEENEKQAREMITELSEFLRYSLISSQYDNVPLSEEIDAIRHYFAIEKRRYENKLEVALEVSPLAEDFGT
jgi:LytS/YehU family sensor histidine kinase